MRTKERRNDRTHERTIEGQGLSEWTNDQSNKPTNELLKTKQWTNGRTNKRANDRINKWTNEATNKWKNVKKFCLVLLSRLADLYLCHHNGWLRENQNVVRCTLASPLKPWFKLLRQVFLFFNRQLESRERLLMSTMLYGLKEGRSVTLVVWRWLASWKRRLTI